MKPVKSQHTDEKYRLISFRPMAKDDFNFILITWLHSLKFGNDYFKEWDDRKYYDKYQIFLKELLTKEDTQIKIACLSEDNDVILGYAIARPPILDFVYVKKAWRNIGLAKELVKHFEITTVSHLTKAGNAIRKRKGWGFEPYEAYKSTQE